VSEVLRKHVPGLPSVLEMAVSGPAVSDPAVSDPAVSGLSVSGPLIAGQRSNRVPVFVVVLVVGLLAVLVIAWLLR
jgi:hypothetical protein